MSFFTHFELIPPTGFPLVASQDFKIPGDPPFLRTSDGFWGRAGIISPQKARLSPNANFTVPLMLWDEPSTLRVSMYRTADMKLVWSHSVLYGIPREIFPPAPPPAGARPIRTRDGRRAFALAKTLDEIASETWVTDVANEKTIEFDSDPAMHILMTVARAVQPNGEPLSFYAGRVWSLTRIVLMLPDVEWVTMNAALAAPSDNNSV